MTDEELIKELRKGDHCGSTYDVDKDDAADRIEQLLKDAEVANDAINHWIVAYNNIEANLAKAVELLTEPVKTHSDTEWLATRNEFLDKLE